MAPTWQFIASDQSGGKIARSAQKTVRENAMRAFRRDERLERVKNFQETRARNPTNKQSQGCLNTSIGQQPLLHLDEGSDVAEKYFGIHGQVLSLQVGSGLAFDPFSSTVLYSHHEAPMLLTHCKKNQSPFLSSTDHFI